MTKQIIPLIITLSCLTGSVQAALVDRGNGLFYDNVLDITVQQNVNLASTQTFGVAGIEIDGSMNWNTAQNWIAAMNDANYLGYADWRMTKVSPLDGVGFNMNSTFDGSSDQGLNIATPNSEMGYMYHVNLQNLGHCDINGTCPQPGWNPVPNVTFIDAATQTSKSLIVGNIANNAVLWSSSDPGSITWTFNFSTGAQIGVNGGDESLRYQVAAVRDGDVAPVPLPVSAWMFLSGLLGMVTLKRRTVQS